MLPILLLQACAPVGSLFLEHDPVFGLDRVHAVDLALGAEALAALEADPEDWVPAGLTFDGASVGTVGVRLKGRSGSWRGLDAKAGWKIDIDRQDPDLRLHGLARLDLDNLVVDCSVAREHVAVAALASLDVPTTRTGYAWVTVDGEPYGLYLEVEPIDLAWLQRRYDDPTGNLYDGDYVSEGGFETQVDFDTQSQDWFELDEGTDVDRADIHAVTAALDRAEVDGDVLGGLDALVDWDLFFRFHAGEAWIGQVDGYVLQANNYRVYFDPADGRADWIPWDLDFAFTPEAEWDEDYQVPLGRVARACLGDPACLAAMEDTWRDVLPAVDADALEARLDAALDLVRDPLAEDPRVECDAQAHRADVDALRTWIRGRTDALVEDWGL